MAFKSMALQGSLSPSITPNHITNIHSIRFNTSIKFHLITQHSHISICISHFFHTVTFACLFLLPVFSFFFTLFLWFFLPFFVFIFLGCYFALQLC